MEPTSPLNPLNASVIPNAALPPASQSQQMSSMDMDQVVVAAKSLVTHYKQDPFRLNAELDHLKSAYLQSEYHIVPNAAEH